jgi:hypothetical protein
MSTSGGWVDVLAASEGICLIAGCIVAYSMATPINKREEALKKASSKVGQISQGAGTTTKPSTTSTPVQETTMVLRKINIRRGLVRLLGVLAIIWMIVFLVKAGVEYKKIEGFKRNFIIAEHQVEEWSHKSGPIPPLQGMDQVQAGMYYLAIGGNTAEKVATTWREKESDYRNKIEETTNNSRFFTLVAFGVPILIAAVLAIVGYLLLFIGRGFRSDPTV